MSATQAIFQTDDRSCDAIDRRPSPKLTEQLSLTSTDGDRLTRWTRAATSPRRLVTRSLIVLLSASGASNAAIATHLSVTRATVALWKARFVAGGAVALLTDAPGRGRKRGRNPHLVARILHAHTQEPPRGARWTLRDIAERVGVSHATVQRVLREHEQSISETPRAAITRAFVAGHLPLSESSSSTRFTHRKVTA